MKTFTTENWGEFSCTLVAAARGSKTLSLHGVCVTSHFHFNVPKSLCAEAGRLFRRADGDAMLDFAERLIDIETGFRRALRSKKPNRARKALAEDG